MEDNRKSSSNARWFLIFSFFHKGYQEQICCLEIISSTPLPVKLNFSPVESLFYCVLIHLLVVYQHDRTPVCSWIYNIRYKIVSEEGMFSRPNKIIELPFSWLHKSAFAERNPWNTCRLECNNSTVSTVTRIAGAVVRAKCICTDSCSIDTIVNSAGTFIDILQECKGNNQRILGARELSQSETQYDLSVYKELKRATFLSHGRTPEVNILRARTLVYPIFSN